jgi:hypothetical protein
MLEQLSLEPMPSDRVVWERTKLTVLTCILLCIYAGVCALVGLSARLSRRNALCRRA